MTAAKSFLYKTAGIFFVLLGLVCNPWILGLVLSPDAYISRLSLWLLIGLGELHFLFLGFLFLRSSEKFPWDRVLLALSVYTFCFIIFLAWDLYGAYKGFLIPEPAEEILSTTHTRDPKIGWKPLPNAHGFHEFPGAFRVSYEMDSDGTKKIPQPPSPDFNIFFFGDSYTFGHGVTNAETFPNLLAEKYLTDKVALHNYGVMGYGFLQMYLRFLEAEPKIKKGDWVIFSPITADLARGSSFFLLLLRDHFSLFSRIRHSEYPYWDKGEVKYCKTTALGCAADVLFENTKYTSNLYVPIKRKLGLTPDRQALEILREIRTRVEAKGAHFLLTFLPMGYELLQNRYDFPLEEFTFANLMPRYQKYGVSPEALEYPDDAHYNKLGHRTAAKAIAEVLWDERLIPESYFQANPHSHSLSNDAAQN